MSKKCSDCKEIKDYSLFHKNCQQSDGYNCYCKKCAKLRNKIKYTKSSESHEWKLAQTLRASKQRAISKGIVHTLTIEDLQQLFPIDNKCPILGIELEWGFPKETSPSLDRIDSSKGYYFENCQIISNRANRIKTDATLQELEAVVNYLKEL